MRLLLDENFDNDLMRGLLARSPEFNIIRAQDVIQGVSDSRVLQWAAEDERILLTHDMNSMPEHCQNRWDDGLSISGLIYVEQIIPIGHAIERILAILDDSDQIDWVDRVEYVTRGSISTV